MSFSLTKFYLVLITIRPTFVWNAFIYIKFNLDWVSFGTIEIWINCYNDRVYLDWVSCRISLPSTNLHQDHALFQPSFNWAEFYLEQIFTWSSFIRARYNMHRVYCTMSLIWTETSLFQSLCRTNLIWS